ncbi:MAG: hypothetical protein AAED33_02800 [Paracoccaceae bacterium]
MPTPPRRIIYDDITQTIGGTSLVKLSRFAGRYLSTSLFDGL